MENQDNKEVKEGNAAAGRPEYGANGGANTSTREDQLPLGGNKVPEKQAEEEKDNLTDLEEQQKGSDADSDREGDSSL